METLDIPRARRLALACAGLWPQEPRPSTPLQVIEHFGYLQLDSVSVAGARAHGLVLHARLDGYDPAHAEDLLRPGAPLFEYWGHEASWLPHALYPVLEFRRRQFRQHPWWGDVLGQNRKLVKSITQRIRTDGPLRTADLEGRRSAAGGWWNLKLATRVATAMWSAGLLAVRQRTGFQRTWDLVENVIPEGVLAQEPWTLDDALVELLRRALRIHGWATPGTLAATWRLRNMAAPLKRALQRLRESGEAVPCTLRAADGDVKGLVHPRDLQRAERLVEQPAHPRTPVLLPPFDPVLWDRARVQALFGFEHVLEIYKPAAQRRWGYYVLPVLDGDALVGRVDLKAEGGVVRVLSRHMERRGTAARKAVQDAVARYAAVTGRKVGRA